MKGQISKNTFRKSTWICSVPKIHQHLSGHHVNIQIVRCNLSIFALQIKSESWITTLCSTHGQLEMHGCICSTVISPWCPGAKTLGHRCSQCWLNIHQSEPVSYSNIIFIGNENITKWNKFWKKWPSCLGVIIYPIYIISSHPLDYLSPKREKVYLINGSFRWIWANTHVALLCGKTCIKSMLYFPSSQTVVNMWILSFYMDKHFVNIAILYFLSSQTCQPWFVMWLNIKSTVHFFVV